jgi:CheY-like chemotaxis protein
LEASNEGDAFSVCDQHDGPIHLMVTDIVMPKMHGPELAKRVSSLYPRDNGNLYVWPRRERYISSWYFRERDGLHPETLYGK